MNEYERPRTPPLSLSSFGGEGWPARRRLGEGGGEEAVRSARLPVWRGVVAHARQKFFRVFGVFRGSIWTPTAGSLSSPGGEGWGEEAVPSLFPQFSPVKIPVATKNPPAKGRIHRK